MEERAMSMKRLLMAALVLGACTMTAHAGLFFGGSAGDASVNDSDPTISFDSSDTGYKLYGGFTFIKFFALEASYLDLGSSEDEISVGTDATIDTTGWDVYAVGILPIGKHFEIFGKAGIIVWDAEVAYSGLIKSESDESGSDPAYGAGIAFVFGEHFAVRAEYQRFDISDIDKVEMTSVGAEFRF
jgi:OOP family OmpA-OmpF porin